MVGLGVVFWSDRNGDLDHVLMHGVYVKEGWLRWGGGLGGVCCGGNGVWIRVKLSRIPSGFC